MSNQQIPNLLSLRGGPRSRGSRGRGRGRGVPGQLDESASASQYRQDLTIQSTDTDAAVSRLSAVNLGYLQDPYASYFVSGSATRRQPLINRGTYTRTTCLDNLIDAFIAQDGPGITRQIISLGAGTDTRYFRLRDQNKTENVIYHEFDFPSVSATKWRNVATNQLLAGQGNHDNVLFPEFAPDHPRMSESEHEWGFTMMKDGKVETVYCFHPMDLRHLSKSKSMLRGMRLDVPTLIVSECCLCYMEVDDSNGVMRWFADRIPTLGMILYEPIGADDSFGQMMVANLAARGIVMPSTKAYKTLADQERRLLEHGFNSEHGSGGQKAETIEHIWEAWVPLPEKQRLDHLEGLDEIEEWQMLARHYAVVWGWRGDGWGNWASIADHD